MEIVAPNNVMVIGVGGTGKIVLTYLKQSLVQAVNQKMMGLPKQSLEPGFGETVPENIRLLCLDADSKQFEIDGISLNYDQVAGDEFICVGNKSSQLSAFKKNLLEQARLRNDKTFCNPAFPWFEADDAERLTILPDNQGAGVQRHYSRLSFMMEETNTQSTLANNLTTRLKKAISAFAANGRDSYFVVVGSIAGGTGAGVIQDVMRFVRSSTSNLQNVPSILGIVVLSKAFTTQINNQRVDGDLMKSNCLAAMREFERHVALKGAKFPSPEYPGSEELSVVHDHPCDLIYLLDGTRPTTGKDLSQNNISYSLLPAISDYLFAQCITNQKVSFDVTNSKNNMNLNGDRCWSTFGTHSWLFPVDDIISSFSVKLAMEYVAHILEPASPNTNHLEEVEGLNGILYASENYYGLNTPEGQHYRGVSKAASDRFGLLNQLLTLLIEDRDKNQAPFMSAAYFREKFFNPKMFPKRYFGKTMNRDMFASIEFPELEPGCDSFPENTILKDLDIPEQVIRKADEIFNTNIGDKNDSSDTSLTGAVRVTYHSRLSYYERLARENFGGYRDPDGVYRPGILENKLFSILNELVAATELVNEFGETVVGDHNLPKYSVSYQTGRQPLERSIAFCQILQQRLQKVLDILDKAYTATKIEEKHLSQVCQEAAHAAAEEYKNSHMFTRRSKKKAYLQRMQDWLEAERCVIFKRSTDKIVRGFMGLVSGWLETLERCRATYRDFNDKLITLQNDVRLTRNTHKSITTRTYLIDEDSPEEKALYARLFTVTQTSAVGSSGQVVSKNRRDLFINSSMFDMCLYNSDTDTRPGVIRTGREIRAKFNNAETENDVFAPKDILRHAAYWCQEVRNVDFWSALLANPAYQSTASGFPASLANELNDNTDEFINYSHISDDNSVIKTIEDAVYVDSSTAATINLQAMFTAANLTTSRAANRDFGQNFRMTAIRQRNCLSISSLAGYGNQFDIYRRKIAAGARVHVNLGEKYACFYEQMILDEWRSLGLVSKPSDNFTLPVTVAYALQNRSLLKNLVWAGLYLNSLVKGGASGGGSVYHVTSPQGTKVELGRSTDLQVPLLEDIMPEYITNSKRQSNLPQVWEEVKTALEKMIQDKDSDRDKYEQRLQSLLTAPLNFLITESGRAMTTFVDIVRTARTNNVATMSDLEKFELLCKCFILEELR